MFTQGSSFLIAWALLRNPFGDSEIMNGMTIIRETPESVAVEKSLYGLLAEFEEHEQVLEAATRAYAEGYRAMDAYSPFPVEGLAEALGHHTTIVPLLTLLG